jgi:hypothetical protein
LGEVPKYLGDGFVFLTDSLLELTLNTLSGSQNTEHVSIGSSSINCYHVNILPQS